MTTSSDWYTQSPSNNIRSWSGEFFSKSPIQDFKVGTTASAPRFFRTCLACERVQSSGNFSISSSSAVLAWLSLGTFTSGLFLAVMRQIRPCS